jgi:hypothetical protein
MKVNLITIGNFSSLFYFENQEKFVLLFGQSRSDNWWPTLVWFGSIFRSICLDAAIGSNTESQRLFHEKNGGMISEILGSNPNECLVISQLFGSDFFH